MRYELRPLGAWTGPETWERQSSGRFRARWDATRALLGRETEALGAGLVVIQIDVRDGEIRRDGMLAARARVGHPGVRVSFDSKHGPLTYCSDAYEHRWPADPPSWQANVRAIALALEALRAVDRYGVTKTGEQYRGWTAIEGGSATSMSVEAAARLLADAGDTTRAAVLSDPAARQRAYRHAAQTHHPDAGGDEDVFDRITEARDVLDAAGDLVAGGHR